MDLKEIKQVLREKGPDLFRQYDVDLAYLFGSAARDRLRERSDVDIAIRFKPSLPKDRYFYNLVRLESALIRLVPRKIDLAILNFNDALLRYEVIRNGVVLYSADEEARALFHIRTYRDYDDFCHAQNFYVEAMRQRHLGENS